MKVQSAYLLGILATIILGVVCYINLCSGCIVAQNLNADVNNASVAPITPDPMYSLSVEDNSFSINVDNNFNFKTSEPSFLMPVPSELKEGVLDLKEYLDAHPNKVIEITGLYAADEINNSDFPDLGLARANSVKNHFLILGIASNQLLPKSKMEEKIAATDNILYGPIAYQIVEQLPAVNESQPQQ